METNFSGVSIFLSYFTLLILLYFIEKYCTFSQLYYVCLTAILTGYLSDKDFVQKAHYTLTIFDPFLRIRTSGLQLVLVVTNKSSV